MYNTAWNFTSKYLYTIYDDVAVYYTVKYLITFVKEISWLNDTNEQLSTLYWTNVEEEIVLLGPDMQEPSFKPVMLKS